MKPAELLALLQECYRDRLRLMTDHQASARHVGQYHVNNTYQYLFAREETHPGAHVVRMSTACVILYVCVIRRWKA